VNSILYAVVEKETTVRTSCF